jgi:putative membrane protein
MKWGVTLALLAGLVAAVWLVWAIGFDDVFAAVARAGFSGLLLLCAYALLVFVPLALSWECLLPRGQRRPFHHLYVARLVRDSIAEISPFSPVGGMVAAARLMILKGMTPGYAAASVAADATTEAMAQVAFLAFGLAVGLSVFQGMDGTGTLTAVMAGMLLLAVPGIAGLILLQKRGVGFAGKIAARFFPQAKSGIGFSEAIHAIYASPRRLAASASLHLLAWIGAGGGAFISFRLMGGEITLLEAIALEAMLSTLRSIATFVPAAVGVQEAGYAMLATHFGLPAEMGVAVSLLKRAREIVLGVPALLYWQSIEGRKAFAGQGLAND